MSERGEVYFIGIGDLYEKPNRLGYTSSPLLAGIYDKNVAKNMEGRTDADGTPRWARPVVQELKAWGITEVDLVAAMLRMQVLREQLEAQSE